MTRGEWAAAGFGVFGTLLSYRWGYHNYAVLLGVGSVLFLVGLRWAKQEAKQPPQAERLVTAIDQLVTIVDQLVQLDIEPVYKCTKCSATVREYFNFCPRCGQSKGDGWPCSK